MEKFSKEQKIFLTLACIFVTLLVVSNIIAGKLILVGGLIGPAAVLCYAITFAISDTLAEIWGREKTKFVITIGFLVSVLSALMIKLAIEMPYAPFWDGQNAFSQVLGTNIRIVFASMIAYLISQHHDLWAFNFWKEKTNGRHLWFRNNMSTLVSQLIDTSLFITIAFYGTGAPMISLITGQYIIKLVIALVDTPIVYLLVRGINRALGLEKTYMLETIG